MAEMPEIELTEEERATSESVLEWTRTPEGIARIMELLAEGRASGPPVEVDMKAMREEAGRRVKRAAEKAA